MTVQRWTGLVSAHESGGFVAVGDYLELEREVTELKAKLSEWQSVAVDGAALVQQYAVEIKELKAKLAEVPQIHTTPVAYQYKYGDYWRCSNGEQINGSYPTKARSLYVMKDEI